MKKFLPLAIAIFLFASASAQCPDVDPQASVATTCSYSLPIITGTSLSGFQNYYDATGGPTVANVVTGPITSSTTVFIYDGTPGCSDEETLVITIFPDVTPPTFNPQPISVAVLCSFDVPVANDLGWNDNCDGTGMAVAVDVSNGASCPETITRTWTYTDAYGNNATVSQTIIVNDYQVPTASNPVPISVPTSMDVPAPDVTVVTDEADQCQSPVVAFVSDVSDGLMCPETITRTYSITDDCGNYIFVTQLITIGCVGINELSNTPKQLLKIVDLMGRETEYKPNTVLIYVFDDGSTEKVFKVEL